MASINDWHEAVLEFFSLTNLSVNDQKELLETRHSAEIVKQIVESNDSTGAKSLFIAAVVSAGTHTDIVNHVSGSGSTIPEITGPVAMLLRYADAMTTLREFNGAGCYPGAFVFGAVRIMITAASEHMELFLDLSDYFEEVNRLLGHLDGYLSAPHTMDTIMPSFIRVSIDILRFCGHVTKYIKGQPQTQKNDLDVTVQALNQDIIDLSKTEVNDAKFTTTSGSSAQHECSGQLQTMWSEQDVKDWLQPATVTEYETYLSNEHYLKGTCQWLRHDPAFLSWVNGRSSSHLWVHGLPGTGKSVLAANAISILKENNSAFTGYFFCSRNEPAKRSASSIIRTIINQLAQQSPRILNNLNGLRLQEYHFAQPLSLTWRQLVVEQLEHRQERMYIVIDGLDECEAKERKELMGIIVSSAQTANIFWLIFSRYDPDIAKALVGPDFILKPTDSRHDIRMYVEQYVNKSRLMSSEPIKMQIVDRLSKAATGIFLWVKLILQQLEKEKTVSGVLSTLQSLPLGTESLYHKILETLDSRFNNEQSRIVSSAFAWITSASRSLTMKELTEAVGLSLLNTGRSLDLERILRRDCIALISVSSSGFVRFIHQTFHEYITSNDYNGLLAVNLLEAHASASNVTLSYLSNSAFSNKLSSTRFQTIDINLLSDKYPLLSYSALYWPMHIDYARAERNPDLLKRLSDFVSSTNLLTTMVVALTIEGLPSLQRWMVAFSHLETRLQNTNDWEGLKRFVLDFRRLIRHYGHILDKFPCELYYLIDECFPRKSHFWKYFGRPAITFADGQNEEWDPFIIDFKQQNVSCIAVSPNNLLAAYDESGISVWNLDSYTEIVRIPISSSLVVAIAFNKEDCLAILTQDGYLRFASPPSWEIKNEWTLYVDLPTAVRNWQGSQFWNNDFNQFDPLQVPLDFAGKGLLAGDTLINMENWRRRQAIPGLSPSLTVCQLRCTLLGDLIVASESGEILTRRLGSQSSLEHFNHGIEPQAGEASARRLLSVSNTGQLIATCEINVQEGYASSGSVLECWGKGMITCILRVQLAAGDKITCAAFSIDESMLAVNSYNARTLADTTKIWMLLEMPQLVWEAIRYKEHTTSLAFGLEDSVLIQAGRFLRVWDVSKQPSRPKLRSTVAPHSLAVKFSGNGRQIASIPIKQESSSLVLWSTDCDTSPVEIPWPSGLDRDIYITDPLAYSADDMLIAWERAIISTKTRRLVGSAPLLTSEKICKVCGFSPDSSTVVYCVNRRSSFQPPENPSFEAVDSPVEMSNDEMLHHIISYKWNEDERRSIFSALELTTIRIHPTRLSIGFIARPKESQWTVYIYDLYSSQFVVTIPWSDQPPDPHSIFDMTFSTLGSLTIVYPRAKYKVNINDQTAWADINITRLCYGGNEVTKLHSDTYQISPWVNYHLLPSGKILYFFRDGWIMLWDDKRGLSRVKYLSPYYQLVSSASSSCAAVEVGAIIRVAFDGIKGLTWFDIKSDEVYDVAMEEWVDLSSAQAMNQ